MIKIGHFLFYDERVRKALGAIAFLLLLLVISAIHYVIRPRLLTVSFYNIGQGDSIFIETPERFQILIDGGPGPRVLEEIAKDLPFYDRSLDLLISSHPDADHISGLIDILERYQVASVILSPKPHTTLAFKRFMDDLAKEGAVARYGIRTQKFEIPGGVSLQFLNPPDTVSSTTTNEAGVVTLLEYNKFKLLLLADVSSNIERAILPSLPRGITVLKIAHHGSRFSSDPLFLKTISPQLCVIQVGENTYGHPSRQALESISNAGCQLWRTDRQGTLTLNSDGESYWVQQ